MNYRRCRPDDVSPVGPIDTSAIEIVLFIMLSRMIRLKMMLNVAAMNDKIKDDVECCSHER